jgi:hypothetical protein
VADGLLQRYVDQAGNLIATEEFEPNREPWKFAQVLPSIPENSNASPAPRCFNSTRDRRSSARAAAIYTPASPAGNTRKNRPRGRKSYQNHERKRRLSEIEMEVAANRRHPSHIPQARRQRPS